MSYCVNEKKMNKGFEISMLVISTTKEERSISNWQIPKQVRNDEHEGNVMLNLFQHLNGKRQIPKQVRNDVHEGNVMLNLFQHLNNEQQIPKQVRNDEVIITTG